ncbi:hypothetical protein ACG91D_18855 [Acinetobacter guillouiae]|uniref:hypothetical protein n=1 Tax=Acinetobacter guillouiae TaxID=106649 RepID=UPI003AF45D1D
MLIKANFQPLNFSYLCATNARFLGLHPSPINVFQATTLLSKAKTRVNNMFTQGTASPLAQALQTIAFIPHAPWCNSNIPPLKLHPLIAQSIFSMQQVGVNLQSPGHYINHLQIHLQTQHYFEAETEWTKTFKTSEQVFNTCIQKITKNVFGFEIQEFSINCDSVQNGSLQFTNLISLINTELSELLNRFEPDKFLALFLKKEPCINQKVNLRFIVVLQKDFIDEPAGFSNFSFFESLKYTTESNSCYTINYDSLFLNGFLQTNRFNKKNPDFKERIKYLKNYLIGTDTLYRIDGLQPTFEVVYSKFD